MEEKDSDYFFGRNRETVQVLNALATAPDKLPVLLGNSGVGKSSLAQAGVLAALKRQAWPEGAGAPGAWPPAFKDSRRWCFLTLRPGTEPLKALVECFLDTWQLGATDPERVKQQSGWIELLSDGKAALRDLLDATARRYQELDQPKPASSQWDRRRMKKAVTTTKVRSTGSRSHAPSRSLASRSRPTNGTPASSSGAVHGRRQRRAGDAAGGL
jgi:hypothetical protein